jgi:hypothetical protein
MPVFQLNKTLLFKKRNYCKQYCGSGFIESGFSVNFDDKKFKQITAEIFFHLFDQNWQLTYLESSLKDIPTTVESFSPQNRTSSALKNEIYYFFSFFMGHFCPAGSGSGSTALTASLQVLCQC